jgi:hypothetical protein
MMFYLLKAGITPSLDVEEGDYPSTYGLFDLADVRHPKPVVKPNEAESNKYYSTTSDLAVATANYFKEKFGPINSIDATEMLEAVNFPIRSPIVEFLPDTNCAVYSRFGFKEYMSFMKELTKQLDGKK